MSIRVSCFRSLHLVDDATHLVVPLKESARTVLPQRAANNTTVQAQVNEMQLVREKVYQMEQQHMTVKQK